MKLRAVLAMAVAMAVGTAAAAQDGGGTEQRGGRGGMGMMGNDRNLMGTVTEVAVDHFRIKTYLNETYVVHYSVNTRFVKMPAGMGVGMGGGEGMRRREDRQQGQGSGGMAAPVEIKATDIKVGDDIGAMGEIDPVKKEADAVTIVLMDPERARAMRATMAGYGKTWLMGKVTGIDGVKIVIESQMDNQKHEIVADENTTLRKRREPVTLADIQVGDSIRAEGSLKDGVFTAKTINVMAMPQGGLPTMPRNGPPKPQEPQQ
jgi:uncharacterized spore protein YtfJ